MKLKKYWKTVFLAMTGSPGRFWSIVCLLALGSATLFGLKVTGPNLESAGQQVVQKQKMADFQVVSNLGFSKSDQNELKGQKDVTADFAYEEEGTLGNKAIRLFSLPKISKPILVKGTLPKKNNEVALSANLQKQYRLGQKITISLDKSSQLKSKTGKVTVTAFVQSPEFWANNLLGTSTKRTGTLEANAYLPKTAFSGDYTVARIRYRILAKYSFASSAYQKAIKTRQQKLTTLLADNGKKRRRELVSVANKKLQASQKQLDQQSSQLKLAKMAGQDVTAAAAKLQAAQKELNGQKEEITSLPQGTYSLYTRSTWPGGDGYSSYKNEVNAVKAVANVFPIIFYLVAALVVFTTMTRFVDEERQNSGLLRALGYSKKTVMGKFVIYGLVTSILGSAIGVILGNYVIAPVVSKICVRGMIIQKVVLGVYPGYLVLILLAALLAAVWPSFWVARRDLKDVPASLLLPKPPAAGSKILLEKITFVWNYLSFQGKVTARNIFRYKQRMLMTIFGVAGSVALLFTGLGIRSAISGIVNRQYQEIFSYDLLAVEKTGSSSKAKKKLGQKVNQLGQSEWIYYETSDNFVKGSSESQTISLIVPQKALKLINLDNRKSGKKIALPKTGAVISEKLAKLAGVKVGDKLSVNLAGQKRQVKVRAICEMYAGHYLLMSKTAFEKATGKKYETNSVLVKLKGAKIAASSKALLKLSATQAVIQNQAMITNLKQTVNSLQTVMIILLILSIQLAVVILYNLTNINVSERVRELSTIKVLGLHNHEVTNYIYRETVVLSIIGIFSGLLLGRIMDLKILEMMAADAVMFDPAAPWFVYLAPFAEIIIILGILWMVVDKKLSKIDMLGALKAVD